MSNQPISSGETVDIDNFISATTTSNTSQVIIPDVFTCKNLPDTIRYILYNNTTRKNNETLTEDQEQTFEIIEQLRENPQKMFMYLQKRFAKLFDIDLRIIAFVNGKFSLIKNDECKKNYMAFVSFNEDNTVRGPLYTVNAAGTEEAVFSIDNYSIIIDVYMYVIQLDDQKLTEGSPQIQEQQAVNCEQELRENSLISNIPSSTDHLTTPFDPNQMDIKTQARFLLDQMLCQLFRIIDGFPVDPCALFDVLQPFVSQITPFEYFSPQDAIMASKDGITCFSNLVQLAERVVFIYSNAQINMQQPPSGTNIEINSVHETTSSTFITVQNETNETLTNAPSSSHDSITTVNENNASVETVERYGPPTLNKRLESTVHPRTLKEFAETGSNPVQCIDSNQRDPIAMGVPPTDETELYVEMEVLDISNQTHLSKIIVPDGTAVEDDSKMNNNDLKCLNFTACDQSYNFNDETRRLCSKISSSERQNGRKEIRIHTINLYQRGKISRKIVREKNLKQCRLAFCFCTLENTQYKRVSPRLCSDIIEDRTTCSRTKIKKATVNNKPKRLCKKLINVHKDHA